MTLPVGPEGLAAAPAQVEALSTQLSAAHAAAGPVISPVAAPAADPPEELARRGAGIAQTWASDTDDDAGAAISHGPGCGLA